MPSGKEFRLTLAHNRYRPATFACFETHRPYYFGSLVSGGDIHLHFTPADHVDVRRFVIC